MPPFIEAEVIECKDPKKQILDILEEKAKKRLDVSVKWVNSEDNPVLRVDYDDEQAFNKSYSREKMIYENFITYLQKQDVTINELFPKKPVKQEEDIDLYLILKYTTDNKEPIRKNYNFTYKIVDFLGIEASYEEVYDGFLLFYKTKQDFIDASMDMMNIDKITEWLKEKNMWTDIMQDFFQIFQ